MTESERQAQGPGAADGGKALVSMVFSFRNEADVLPELIERVTPDVLVKGEDWAERGVVGREWVESHGGQVVLAPLVPGASTTSILQRAAQGRTDGSTPEPEAD